MAGYVSPGGEVWLRHPEAIEVIEGCLAQRVAVAAFELAREDADGTKTLWLPTTGSVLLIDDSPVTPEAVEATVARVRELFREGLPREEWWFREQEPAGFKESARRATLVSFFLRDQETTVG